MKKTIIGNKYNRLKVISYHHSDSRNQSYYLCKCDCGNEKIIRRSHLVSGKIKSCGCYKLEVSSRSGEVKSYKHGKSRTRLYKVFRDMKTRCYNSNSPDYKNYGMKGVKICEEWLQDYLIFEKWAIENGYDENAPKGICTIDRINVNGNYEPSNCRWVSITEQNKNKSYRTTKLDVNILEEIKKYPNMKRKEVAEKLNISETKLKYILKYYKTTLKKLWCVV